MRLPLENSAASRRKEKPRPKKLKPHEKMERKEEGPRVAEGVKINRLTAIRKIKGNSWQFECECGKLTTTLAFNVECGATKSCGCLLKESTGARFTTHGLSRTNVYRMWSGIKSRTTNPSDVRYKDYGGRGIKMFPQWAESFEVFLSYVGERPSKSHTFDRINNDAGYEPGNVRWVDMKVQGNNRRNNIRITIGEETKTLCQWMEVYPDIPYHTIRGRLLNKWSPLEAFTTPIRPSKRVY